MGITDYITRKADNVGAAVSGLAGGLALGQFPQYLAQYLQRLGGHIDQAASSATEFNVPELAQRATEMKTGLEHIVNASTLGKLGEFAQHINLEVAKRTLEHYTPGMTFNQEGLLYAGVGAAAALVCYELAKGVIGYALGGKSEPAQA